MQFSKQRFCFLVCVIVYTSVCDGIEFGSSAVSIAEEIGYGLKGLTHYLNKLLEGCDNVGDLNNWVVFMESHLACENSAWPYQADEDKLLKTNLQLIDNFCDALPKRMKCSSQLARKMDFCYGPNSEKGKKGSNAIRISDSYARFICQNRAGYLENVDSTEKNTSMDKKSLKCFKENRKEIEQCIQNKESTLSSSNVCANLGIVESCMKTIYEKSCTSDNLIDWIHKLTNEIKVSLRCHR